MISKGLGRSSNAFPHTNIHMGRSVGSHSRPLSKSSSCHDVLDFLTLSSTFSFRTSNMTLEIIKVRIADHGRCHPLYSFELTRP